jgi:hypothetical protein
LKEKNGEKLKVYKTPCCPDDPVEPIVIKFGKVGGMDYVMNCAKFGVDQLRGVGSAGS